MVGCCELGNIQKPKTFFYRYFQYIYNHIFSTSDTWKFDAITRVKHYSGRKQHGRRDTVKSEYFYSFITFAVFE